jgi:hypothetical protein
MAEIRFNYGDKFTQTTDTNTGIGSTIPAAKLDVAGTASAGSLRVTGIATLSSVSGFVNTKLTTSTQDMIVEAGNSGSVSGEVVVSTGQTISVSTAATTGQGGIQSLKVYETFMPPVGGTADRPTDVKPGMVYYNKDFKTIEFWDGNFWKQVDNTTRSGRAVIYQGYQPSYYPDMIDFIQITTLGNTQYFGNQNGGAARDRHGCGSDTRGVFGGGVNPGSSRLDSIEYVTLQSQGNGIDFGDLTQGMGHSSSCSSSTRGLFGGGYQPSLNNTINYVEIQTLGNALDFGDLFRATGYGASGASPTRGIFCGGSYNAPNDLASEHTEFFTFASKGNGTDFGGMTGRFRPTSCGAHLSVFTFGSNASSGGIHARVIDQTNTVSLGKSVNFGELPYEIAMAFAAGNNTRVVVGSGQGGGQPTFQQNNIQFITIATRGNSVDFGEATLPTVFCNATSDSHGGLGGF